METERFNQKDLQEISIGCRFPLFERLTSLSKEGIVTALAILLQKAYRPENEVTVDPVVLFLAGIPYNVYSKGIEDLEEAGILLFINKHIGSFTDGLDEFDVHFDYL